jgi:hypothetical protein
MIPYRVPCTNQFTKKLKVAGKCGSFNKMNALKTHTIENMLKICDEYLHLNGSNMHYRKYE